MVGKKEFKIGLFVIVVLVATFAVINFLRGADLFGREIEIVGHFDNVQALVASAPVQIRGYAAGRVTEVSYDRENDNFRVVCSVNKEFRIPSDSRMVLYSTSIMGGKGVRIDIGESDSYVTDGGELSTGADVDLISMIYGGVSPIMEKLSNALDSVNVVLGNVNCVLDETNRKAIKSSLAHLNVTLANAENLSEQLNGKSDDIKAIISDLKNLSSKLGPIADSAASSMENVDKVTAELKEADLKGAVKNISGAASQINETVGKIKQPLEDAIKDVDDFINKVKDNPKKYLKISVF